MRKTVGVVLGILLLVACLVAGCGISPGAGGDKKSAAGSDVTIEMLNVGQGDSILIKTGTQTVLIDTSDVDERDKLKKELDKAGVKKIDKVILTHPHADHIGGMDVLLKDYEVSEVFDNGMPSPSKLYIDYMKALKTKNIKHTALKAGDVLDFGNGVSFHVYFPTEALAEKGRTKDYKHDPNNESVVGRLVYGNFSMLFTGDAEAEVESELLKTDGIELKSTILKAPHHGSATSSSVPYLEKVLPEFVVISCGAGNEYGHPHADVMARFRGDPTFKDRKTGKEKKTKLVKDANGNTLSAKVYETDKDGDITIVTNGKTYSVKTEGR